MPVSAFVVARAETCQLQRIVCPDLRHADPARPGPAYDLIGERPARVEPALDRGQQRLYVTEVPAEEPSGAFFGNLEPFCREFLGFSPVAPHEVVEAQVRQGRQLLPRRATPRPRCTIRHSGSRTSPTRSA